MRKLAFFYLILFFTFTYTYSQNRECDCSDALNKSLKDKYTESQLLDLRVELYEYFVFLKNESKNTGISFNLSAAAQAFTSYGLFDGTSGSQGNYSNSKTQNLSKKIEKSQSISESTFKEIVVEVFSDNQLEAYKLCLNSCPKENGVFYEVTGDLEDVFALNLKFKNTVGKKKVTIKSNPTLVNCEPIGGLILKQGLDIIDDGSVTQYLKIINKEKPAQIGINFTDIAFRAINFGDEYIGRSKTLPIGAIISSNLKYTTFLEVNNFKITENMSKVIWVPCDGRNVSSSKYGKFSGNVPDLRGLFLRNVNDYGVEFDGVSKVDTAQSNPENTKAGVFQNESFKAHTHGLRWWASGGRVLPNVYPGINNSYNPNVNQASSKGVMSSGGNETRPKNMTVYYYVKIN